MCACGGSAILQSKCNEQSSNFGCIFFTLMLLEKAWAPSSTNDKSWGFWKTFPLVNAILLGPLIIGQVSDHSLLLVSCNPVVAWKGDGYYQVIPLPEEEILGVACQQSNRSW